MSSSPTSPSSRCVRDALFLPDEALSRLSLLVGRGGRGKGGGPPRHLHRHHPPKKKNSSAAELALVVRMGELAKRLDAALSLMRVWWDASLENNVRCLTEKSGYSVQNFRKERRANPGPNSFSTEAVFFFFRSHAEPFVLHPPTKKKKKKNFTARQQRRLFPPGVRAAPRGPRGGPADPRRGRGGLLAALRAPRVAKVRAPRGLGRRGRLCGVAPVDRRGARGGRCCRHRCCWCCCCRSRCCCRFSKKEQWRKRSDKVPSRERPLFSSSSFSCFSSSSLVLLLTLPPRPLRARAQEALPRPAPLGALAEGEGGVREGAQGDRGDAPPRGVVPAGAWRSGAGASGRRSRGGGGGGGSGGNSSSSYSSPSAPPLAKGLDFPETEGQWFLRKRRRRSSRARGRR